MCEQECLQAHGHASHAIMGHGGVLQFLGSRKDPKGVGGTNLELIDVNGAGAVGIE